MSYPDEVAPDFISPHDPRDTNDQPLKHLDTVIALYDFHATQPSHLPLRLGDTVYVLAKSSSGWWDGVIIATLGDLQRGWFPHNYVRLVNYVQPVLNKLKNNKELDNITAANTAANVLIPLFTNLLQKNLGDTLERLTPTATTRKNSVVLFALEETENLGPAPGTPTPAPTQHNPLVATTITAGSAEFGGPGLEENLIFILELEAERLSDQYVARTNNAVTWIPRSTPTGDFSFYSPQLDLYCAVMPVTNFSITDGDVPPQFDAPDIEELKKTSKMVPLDPLQSTRKMQLLIPTLDLLGLLVFKRDSNALSLMSQTLSLLYHNFTQLIFYLEDLFYGRLDDITKWDQVVPQLTQVAEYSMRALREHNKLLFNTHLDRLQNLVLVTILASRLTQDDFIGTKKERLMKRKLRHITSLFGQFYTNGILFLLIASYLAPLNEAGLLSNDIKLLNKMSPQVGLVLLGGNYLLTPSSQLTLSKLEPHYFAQCEKEMASLVKNVSGVCRLFMDLTAGKKVVRSQYDSSDTDGVLDDDEDVGQADRLGYLPQVYPRFLIDEFNGGNWCNPFFNSQNPVLNVSGDDLKNRYHSKVIIDQGMLEGVVDLLTKMQKLADQTVDLLDPLHQRQYYNDQLKLERNTLILRLVYKYLFHALLLVDVIELLDFTVFCLVKRLTLIDATELGIDDEPPLFLRRRLRKEPEFVTLEFRSNLTFDYPVVLEFFQLKQKFHDLIMSIVMGTQALTLDDPDVFRGLKEEEPLIYNKDKMKLPSEKAAAILTAILTEKATSSHNGLILRNTDSLLTGHINESVQFLLVIQKILQRLIEERETILNYATRVLHEDLNVQLLVIERNNTIHSDKGSNSNPSTTGGDNIVAAAVKKNQRGSGLTSSDSPWFLEGDEEFDLILDIKGNVKGGTKEALVAHLTHHDLFDLTFNAAFLLTFSTMMLLGELLALLIQRFNMDAPEGLLFEEYNTWILKKRNPIRLRVMNIMKLIVEKHWTVLYYNELVLKRWLQFAQLKTVQGFLIGKLLATELTKVLNHEQVCVERQPVYLVGKAPAPLIKGLMLVKKMKLMDIDYMELARQLTIREFAMYLKISKFACLAKVWGKKLGLSELYDEITSFIRALNQLTNFVAYMILRKSDPRKRVQVIRYWVQVAEKCRQYNNYSLMTAIILALYSSPIHRLKKTWKYLHGETQAQLHNMNRLMNSLRNFNEYRDVLKFIGQESCVPFFGVYLSDLTFVFHGNPDNLMNRLRLINFAKRAKTCEIVTGIDRFKTTGYNLQLVKEIQQFLDMWFEKCPTIAEQYQISLQLEPRETASVTQEVKVKK